MRWILVLLVLFVFWWYLGGKEPTLPPTAEESFIGEPIKSLRKAEEFEKRYLKAAEERKQRMEEQAEVDSGG